MDLLIITAPVKASTEFDKLRFLCDKVGVVRYFNKQVIKTHYMDVLTLRAPVKTGTEFHKLQFLCDKI